MKKGLRPPRLLVATAISALAISGLSYIALGQVTTGSVGLTQVRRGTTGVPYLADEFNETTQILFDGNRITHKTLTKLYRDSEGRTRREFYRINSQGVPDDSPVSISIVDDAAGVLYTLDPRTHTARKREMRIATNSKPANTTGTTAQQPGAQARPAATRRESRSESLGSQLIEGFNTEGTRTTTVIPAGEDGNEQPVETVSERWFSPELHISLLMKYDDPRSGQRVIHVTNIRLEEPSPDLFQVPPDYTVEEIQPPVPIAQTKPADN